MPGSTYGKPYAESYGGTAPDSPLDAGDDSPGAVAALWSISDLSPVHHWSGTDKTGSPSITAVTDLGSGGVNLSVGTGSPQEGSPAYLGSRASIVCTDDYLTGVLEVSQPFTLWLVMAFDNIAGNDGWFMYSAGGTITMRVGSGSPNTLHVGTDGSFGTTVDTFAPADDTSYLIAFYCNGTSSQIWVNDTEYTVDTTGWGSGSFNSPQIGGRDGGNMADVTFAEVAITSGAPSASDRSSFESWRAANAA